MAVCAVRSDIAASSMREPTALGNESRIRAFLVAEDAAATLGCDGHDLLLAVYPESKGSGSFRTGANACETSISGVSTPLCSHPALSIPCLMHQLYTPPLTCFRSPPLASFCAVREPEVRPKQDGGPLERACGHWLASLASTPPDHFLSTRCLFVLYRSIDLHLASASPVKRSGIKVYEYPNAPETTCLIFVKLSLQLKSHSLTILFSCSPLNTSTPPCLAPFHLQDISALE